MPASFPQVWLKRVILLITTLTMAPWLDGIEELDVTVAEMGSGTASELNAIHIPIADFEADVLINNTTYPIPTQAYTDDEVIVQLDKYQTKVTTLADDAIHGAAYDKIDVATKAHTTSILKNKFKKAIHALAPAATSANTPILVATGASVAGRGNRLLWADLVAAKDSMDKIDCPEEGRRLVLSTDHYNDLLLDNTSKFATILANAQSGKLVPTIAGFEIYSYLGNPYYEVNATVYTKKAYGSVIDPADRKASVFFLKANVAKKTGATKQYFDKAENNPTTQSNSLNYRHYFIALPFRNKFMGAIV